MLTRGGDRQASRAMWEQLGQSEENDWLRQTAQLRLMQLDALDQIDALERIVKRVRARDRADCPRHGNSSSRAGLLRGVPVDPTGTPYTLNSATGK